MNATTAFPFHLHWNPQQITDAVPPRLFEVDLFAVDRKAAASANAGTSSRGKRHAAGYLPKPGLPAQFRVRG
ncbi:hypothetical protein [Luteimonas sp. R10]|uniref:hypothetical protein n=1 Tax=Luteimonas sp. R10 TaxID=3108176 RepID=UPI0030921720|nr:hypothetical protein U3649_05615 [Luteimonas sp. R10]